MYVGEKATVVIYNKLVDDRTNKVLAYSCFNLKTLQSIILKKSNFSNCNYFGRDLSNSKGFNLFYEDRLPIVHCSRMQLEQKSSGIVVLGKLDFNYKDCHTLYLFTMGDSKLYLYTEEKIVFLKNYLKTNVVNIDNDLNYIRCNKATIPTLNTYRFVNAYFDKKLFVELEDLEEKEIYEFLLNFHLGAIYKTHNHDTYKVDSERHNLEVLSKKEEKLKEDLNKNNKNLFNSYISNKSNIQSLYLGDSTIKEVLGTVNPDINSKSNISAVQCNIDMSDENKNTIVEEYGRKIGFCTDEVCNYIFQELKKYINTNKESSKQYLLNEVGVCFDRLFQAHDFSQPPCVSCYPTQELYGYYVFTTSTALGFTPVRIPTKTFIRTNNGTDFNLGNLKTSYHEYIHYLSTDANGNCGFILFEFIENEEQKKDINARDNEEEIKNTEKPKEIKYARAYRKITEGITDMLAGYFLYINCKNLYEGGKYLYNSKGGKLDLEEIKKTYSPFLKDISTLKSFDNLELDMSKLFNSDEVYKKGAGSSYTYNMILVYCLGHLIGWNDLLSGYFLNVPEYLYELLVNKMGEHRADKFLELLNNENLGSSSVGVLSKQNFDKLRVYLGKGGEIELY